MSANLLTDTTPVPGGSWLTVSFSQNLLGAINIGTSWSDLANQWVSYLPDTWGQQTLCVNDTLTRKDALVQITVPADTSIGAIATICDAISPDVSILDVQSSGSGPLDATTFQARCASNGTTLAICLDDPITCAKKAFGALAIVALVVVGVFVVIDTKAWRYLGTKSWG